ncbi:MAG: S-adenosylmethionine:tRNA ribosyltransferase-isomerase, partial [Bacteroidota bacterium]
MEEQFRNISIAEYTYELPPERIAMHPLQQRDLSNLLVYRHGQIE